MEANPHRYDFPITVKHSRKTTKPYVLKAQRVCARKPCANWLLLKGTRVEPSEDGRVRGLHDHGG